MQFQTCILPLPGMLITALQHIQTDLRKHSKYFSCLVNCFTKLDLNVKYVKPRVFLAILILLNDKTVLHISNFGLVARVLISIKSKLH